MVDTEPQHSEETNQQTNENTTMTETETHLCVTCGKNKSGDHFHVGDCTCKECNEAGRIGVNYNLEDGEKVV